MANFKRNFKMISRDFRHQDSGVVAIIFAPSAIVIVRFIGFAVDDAQAQYVLAQLRLSADAAVLATALKVVGSE